MHYLLEVVFDVLRHKLWRQGTSYRDFCGKHPTPIICRETAAALPLCVISSHPLPEVSTISHRADGMLAGVAPALQSSVSLELLQCLVVQTNLAHQFLAPCS